MEESMRTESKQKTQWIKRWNSWISPTKVPGVWKRKEGGYLVRGRAKDPATGTSKEIRRVLPEADAAAAFAWLQAELDRVRQGVIALPVRQERFADYAVSLLEKKSGAKGTLRSATSRARWGDTLVHLIDGTGPVKGLGEYFVDQIQYAHVKNWRDGIGALIDERTYSPTTGNGWFSILKVIFKHAMLDLQLTRNPTDGIEKFDTSTWSTYTEEEPNALTAKETKAFLEALRADYPQHYAMTLLGLVTGLRPSSLRPLRRKGATPDVLWEKSVILIRRSQTRGREVMNKTKTGVKQRITLPEDVMEVLRWHVETHLPTPQQQGSDLLFPSVTGRFRAPSVLNKPFADVANTIGLGKKFTQRGLRRTFNDLARNANVEGLVTKSISGHLTDRMKDHYSTVSAAEQSEGIGRVIKLVEESAPANEQIAEDGGMHCGMQGVPSGMPEEKAG
jgi:integrase